MSRLGCMIAAGGSILMKPFGAGVAVACSIAVASVAAANLWESKPFNTWTDKELGAVLTDSPWAGKANIKYVRNRANQPPIQEAAVATWASAPVMRQALLRQMFGATPEIPKEAQSVLARTSPYYIVTLKIWKGVNSSNHAGRAMEMLDETFLIVRDRAPIPALEAEGEVLDPDGQTPQNSGASDGRSGSGARPALFAAMPDQRGGGGGGGGFGGGGGGGGLGGGGGGQRSGGGGRSGPILGRGGRGAEPVTTASLIIFRFPRDPIMVADKEVEFVTKLCGGNGFGGGPPLSPPANNQLLFDVAAGDQRGGGGGGGGGGIGGGGGGIGGGGGGGGGIRGGGGNRGGRTGGRMGPAGDMPACNYEVKKTFKLKDMVVKGELAL